MASPSKIRHATIGIATIAIFAVSMAGLAHAQTGTLLRTVQLPEVANHSIYFPVGVAFDGTNLWYSTPATDVTDIFLMNTTGTLLNTIGKQSYAGALAWDGTNLWVATFDATGKAVDLYVISVGPQPRIINTVDITSVILGHGSCAAISGLYYDLKKNTLWVTPNPCVGNGVTNRNTSYEIDTSGNLLKMVSFPIPIASATKVGDNFYVANKGGFSQTGLQGIVQTDENGNVTTSFGGVSEGNEQTTYDPVTFAPNCALWAMHFSVAGGLEAGQVNAYEIPCST